MENKTNMESILNFRDVTESFNESDNKNLIKKGLLFRSGELDNPTEKDVNRLLGYNIHTIIDLKTRYYDNEDEENLLEKLYLLDEDDSRYEYDRKMLNISFGSKKFLRGIMFSAPWNIILKVSGCYLFCQKRQAVKVMGEFMSPYGLHGMYISFLKYCPEAIIEVLEVLTDKSKLPVLICCKHGKDRTGAMIAIILSLLNVPDEIIIKDYLSSLKNLQHIQFEIVKDMGKMGLSEEFSLVNYEAMKYFLDYIKDEYSSVSNYLINHGFSLEKQSLIIQNFTM